MPIVPPPHVPTFVVNDGDVTVTGLFTGTTITGVGTLTGDAIGYGGLVTGGDGAGRGIDAMGATGPDDTMDISAQFQKRSGVPLPPSLSLTLHGPVFPGRFPPHAAGNG